MTTKVLFVPNPMPSHIVPLVALAKLLNKASFEVAFLLPQRFHVFVRNFGFTVLEIDRKVEDRTTPEMMAFSKFKPHVVVDDLSYTTAFSTRLRNLPRISIVRKGIIPFEKYAEGHEHSSGVIKFLGAVDKLNLSSFGMWKPGSIPDLFVGDINIIPSIPSIEELPIELQHNSSYIYCGPLLLSDEEMRKNLKYLQEDNTSTIDDFVSRNKDRKIVYFTHGLTIPSDIEKKAFSAIRFLLNRGVAIITNVKNFSNLNSEESSRFLPAALLPMHKVCSNASLMIHHCGSGTYNYQLTHQVPAIILGSRYYDRDEVGIQLDKLGAACFIAAELSEDDYQKKFEEGVLQLLNSSSNLYLEQKKALSNLNSQLLATSKEFNFEEVITKVVRKSISK